ncbi:MAG TPA: tRNA pseudouridine(55) synthase TruB [Planctomycetaceae bacterium]|jgi:tRNA pseudouridine55 synthase
MLGILNINKPEYMTSRRVVDVVTRLAGTKRAGHAGTLDPLASGVLVVCVGRTTKLVSYLQERPKKYSATFLFGRRSNTDDITGQVVEVVDARAPQRGEVEAALQAFVGTIMQVPPQFSAVHVGGRRAYKAARRGMAVEVEPRPVVVHRIELREYAAPELVVDIECGSGTYIRSIGRDLGNALGCGAVMSSLVRTAIGEFTLDSAVKLPDLEFEPASISRFLLPTLQAVAHLPRRQCDPDECTALLQGRTIPAQPDTALNGTAVVIVDPEGKFFALTEFALDPPRLRPRQVFGGECVQKP